MAEQPLRLCYTYPVIVVFPLPPLLPTNPYLDLLTTPMAAQSVNVRRGRPRTELPRLLIGREARIVHIHFFDELTQSIDAAQTAARSLGFLGLLAALRARGVQQVWTAHNLQPHEAHHPHWAERVYRSVARSSAAIIAHSHAARAQLEQRYGPLPQCVVIPHGNYIGCYGPQQAQTASRAALGLPATGSIVLALGALRPYKGLEDLLQAFASLPAPTRGTLLITGHAKDHAYAATLAQQAASIAGAHVRPQFVPNDAFATYLAAADLVALPYRQMLTSGALLAAFSYGRPVLAPALPPVAELVREGVNGFLFTPGDVATLATALGRAINAPHRAEMGQHALATAQSFDWSTIAAQTADVYRAVLRSTRTNQE